MTDDIVPYEGNSLEAYEKKELAFNGRKAKSSDAEVILALAPIYAAWPNYRKEPEFVNLLCLYLRDIPSELLARVVAKVVETSKFEPTIAHFREAYELVRQMPGPRNDVDPAKLKDVPQRMYRLDPAEDKAQRMERLRETRKWDRYYD